MRIALVNHTNRKLGGTEHYLDVLMPRLRERGMEIAFVYENPNPEPRGTLDLPKEVPSLCVRELGVERVVQFLESWRPDVIFAHGELDPSFEARYLRIAPSIYFSHNYYGTCISGMKTFQSPVVRPCHRRFGAACLLLYFPRQCGGMNPMTMAVLYRNTARRLRILRRYDALVTHSKHLQDEYLRHGFPEAKVHNLKYEVSTKSGEIPRSEPSHFEPFRIPDTWHLMYVGRMEKLKGGRTLIESLPRAREKIGRPIHLSLAGDGPDRANWEEAAERVLADTEGVTIQFHGWLGGRAFDDLMATTHLVTMPSLWPEPFGKAGLEAGLHGIPSAAFDVGGIGEWLKDGVNGHLAPGDPPTSEGIAGAIARCFADADHYRSLCLGARQVAFEFNLDNHIDQLIRIFRSHIHARKSGERLR